MPSEHRRLSGSSQVPHQTRGHPQSSQLPSVEPPPRRAARGDTTPGLCSGRDLVARAPCQVKQPCAIYICATRMCSGECLRRLTTRLGIRGRVHTRPSLNAANRARSEEVGCRWSMSRQETSFRRRKAARPISAANVAQPADVWDELNGAPEAVVSIEALNSRANLYSGCSPFGFSPRRAGVHHATATLVGMTGDGRPHMLAPTS